MGLNSKNFDDAVPLPRVLIESLRAVGYDLQSAIADLVDNSITAKADNIWIDFHWAGESSYIMIRDDGYGMTEEELVNAMYLGSQSPLEIRDKNDLGRFGLGLKTASFSQCRKLTVCSKKSERVISARCWDLDYIAKNNKWRTLKRDEEFINKHFADINKNKSGTIILWEIIDRLVKGNRTNDLMAANNFWKHIDKVKYHLSMVFHRLILKPVGIKIWINNRKIEPWDPFLSNEEATQQLTKEVLTVSKQKIIVTPFILPHHSKISTEQYNKAAGLYGWNAQQGFYIYRNKRLLLGGDWFGFFPKAEQFNLARIRLDIPNSMDMDWEIDIKKSRAYPPASLHRDLKRIARLTRERASAVYKHRGKILARKNSSEYAFLWREVVKHGKIFYTINRDHPIIKDALNSPYIEATRLHVLLRLLEETIPVPSIIMNNAQQPDKHPQPFEGSLPDEVTTVLSEIFKSLIRGGRSINEAQDLLRKMEPFNKYPDLINRISEIVQINEENLL